MAEQDKKPKSPTQPRPEPGESPRPSPSRPSREIETNVPNRRDDRPLREHVEPDEPWPRSK